MHPAAHTPSGNTPNGNTPNGNTPNGVQVITFGCRLNIAESDIMRANAEQVGLRDAVIVNTCAVTAEAQRQARQAIRRLRREHPQTKIIVTGCGVQVSPEMFRSMPEVDRILGNHEKLQPAFFAPDLEERIVMQDIQEVAEIAPHLVTGMEGKVRAFLQVQNGCDHRCTFCIIPYGRGKSRSAPLGLLTQQTRQLVASGVKEIVLTGVDLTAYGADLPQKPTLTEMVRRLLHNVPELPRLRISSLDPAELDETFFELVASQPRILPHFHISLQAGDDLILKRMKRRHLRHHVVDFCANLRRVRPDVVLGADVIAGFPTETESHFRNTCSLLEETGFSFLHVFPFSPRPGTPAARMPQVPPAIIKERAGYLRDLGQRMRLRLFESLVGQVITVLLEKPLNGHSDHFVPVTLQEMTRGSLPGDCIQVRVTSFTTQGLQGECL